MEGNTKFIPGYWFGLKAMQVTKTLRRKTVPRFGLPGSLQSDNGLPFITQIQKRALQNWNWIAVDIVTTVKGSQN